MGNNLLFFLDWEHACLYIIPTSRHLSRCYKGHVLECRISIGLSTSININVILFLDSSESKTFLELLIEGSGGDRGYSDLELQEETLVLALAGTDTSAVGASFTVSMLARYPAVQEQVYKE